MTGYSSGKLGSHQTVAFRDVFDKHAPFVFRVMRHLGVPEADLQDQCQEVFIAVYQGLETFEGRSALTTWLYGICLRVASTYRRRALSRAEVPAERLPDSDVPPSQHDSVEQDQAWSQLRQLLEELDEQKRQVFVLYELEELPMKQVAQLCDCPLQTAYSRLHAARRIVMERFRRRTGVAP